MSVVTVSYKRVLWQLEKIISARLLSLLPQLVKKNSKLKTTTKNADQILHFTVQDWDRKKTVNEAVSPIKEFVFFELMHTVYYALSDWNAKLNK